MDIENLKQLTKENTAKRINNERNYQKKIIKEEKDEQLRLLKQENEDIEKIFQSAKKSILQRAKAGYSNYRVGNVVELVARSSQSWLDKNQILKKFREEGFNAQITTEYESDYNDDRGWSVEKYPTDYIDVSWE